MAERLFQRLFPRRFTRQGWLAIVAGLSVTFLVLAAAGGMVWSDRQSQIAQWTDWTSSLSVMAAEQAHESIGASDLVLRSVIAHAQEADLDTEEEFRALMAGQDIHNMLRQPTAASPQNDVAAVLDTNGIVVSIARWWPLPPSGPLNLADRDYFKEQMANPDLGLYISTPVKSRVTGLWTFFLSRKIKSKSGKTLGVVITGLPVEYFTDFYKTINGSTSHVFAMFRDDGRLMMRFPPREELIGSAFYTGTAASLGLPADAQSNVLITRRPRTTDSTDTRARITALRRVPGYPLFVNTITSEDEFLGAWKRSTKETVLPAVALSVIIAGLTLVLANLLSRQADTMRELEQSRLAAENAAHAKTEFLAMMSHEIRTPINAVIGMSDALLECELPERERGMARIVNDASAHLLSIVNTILDFSRLEAGRDRSSVAPFDLGHVVRSALDLASGLPGANRLAITSRIGLDVPPFLLGDQGRVTQVLLNLLGNAIKFTEQGSIDLDVSRLHKQAEPGHVVLRFAVTDTGSGITKELADRLFEPFERGEGWKSHKGSGTGLGLAISKRLVTLMGGIIGADGEPGVGSVFWFELPFKVVQGVEEARAPADVPGTSRPIEILVAEDSVTSQLVARHFLESLGHKVTIVENGALALAAVQRQHFDLVLMDGHMPLMDGLEATSRIRALGGRFATLPIYGLSANVLNSDREQAARVGMNGYLTKPVRKPEIAAVIARLYPATAE
jgi:signal transduction histidine kinase/CheY-like chemotaxis protein